MIVSCKKRYDQSRQHIKKQRHYFVSKGPSSQSYGFSSSHVWIWELGYKESWAPKHWSFWTVVLEKTLEIPLDCKDIKPVNPKGNQSWIFVKRTDAEAETPIFGHLMWRTNSLEKTLLQGKIEGRRSRQRHRMRWSDGITDLMGLSLIRLLELVMDMETLHLQSMGLQIVRHDWATELTDWWGHHPLSASVPMMPGVREKEKAAVTASTYHGLKPKSGELSKRT